MFTIFPKMLPKFTSTIEVCNSYQDIKYNEFINHFELQIAVYHHLSSERPFVISCRKARLCCACCCAPCATAKSSHASPPRISIGLVILPDPGKLSHSSLSLLLDELKTNMNVDSKCLLTSRENLEYFGRIFFLKLVREQPVQSRIVNTSRNTLC